MGGVDWFVAAAAAWGLGSGIWPATRAADLAVRPPGAIVLFDGTDLSAWVRRRDGAPGNWKVENGYMEVVPTEGYLVTRQKFTDFRLHLEFWIPQLPIWRRGQDRGNSGVYLQGRYEVQILDSYCNPTYPKGACGALYDLVAPSINASKPPEQWQSFDIFFRAPRVNAGRVIVPGEVTVIHNGITVIDHARFDRVTDLKHHTPLDENLGEPGPIMLQEHGSKVRFRNIWILPLDQP